MEFIGIKEISKYLGIKPSTVYSWVNQRAIPHYKIGRLVKFKLVEIEDWLLKKRVKEQKFF